MKPKESSSQPLVSGIIIFFNGENFLEQAIESVLAQTYSNWELLIVDDGSSDRSTEIAQRYAAAFGDKVRYLDHACHQNRGMSASRNLGLRHSKGEYIAFLDHDDIWLPHKLEDQVAILKSRPEVAMMYGRTRYWHGWTGRPEDCERDGFTLLGIEPNRVVAPPDLFTLFLRDDNTIASTCSVLIRREIAERVGGFDEAFRDQYEDMVFLAKIYLEFPVYVSDRCWDYYRQHENNSGAIAIRTGQWHPIQPNPAREKFLNRLERLLAEKAITEGELVETLKSELSPYRNRDQRTPRQVFHDLCSDAALALLRGEDARPFLSDAGDMRQPELTGDVVADWFFDAVPSPRIGDANVWTRPWPRLQKRVGQFMEGLEAQAQASRLAPDAMKALERRIQSKWFLRVEEGFHARLEFPAENPDMLRVSIVKGTAGSCYYIQLNQARLKVKAGHRYALTFLARADHPRSLSFGLAKAHEPWTNLGLYREVALSSEWQCFDETFTALEDEERARIHFDLGGNDTSVDLSAVKLRSISEGRYVEATLPSNPHEHQNVATERVLDESPIPVGAVQFGSFMRITPIGHDGGRNGGLPVDRYYIENFLASHACDIRGRVLVIGDDSYVRKFGGSQVTQIDVLDRAGGNPQATVVGDLADAPQIPSNSFDCIILTGTLIYDVDAAAQTLYRILKPDGVLLATFPGISRTKDAECAGDSYWNFTSSSVRRLFQKAFLETNVEIEAFGNVLAAISSLHGLSWAELTRHELDTVDSGYEVTIAVKASKKGADR